LERVFRIEILPISLIDHRARDSKEVRATATNQYSERRAIEEGTRESQQTHYTSMADTQEDLTSSSSSLKKSGKRSGKKSSSSTKKKSSSKAKCSDRRVSLYDMRAHLEPGQVEKIDELKGKFFNDESLDLPDYIVVWLDDMCIKRYLAAREWKVWRERDLLSPDIAFHVTRSRVVRVRRSFTPIQRQLNTRLLSLCYRNVLV
jgi:hypothetical protein